MIIRIAIQFPLFTDILFSNCTRIWYDEGELNLPDPGLSYRSTCQMDTRPITPFESLSDGERWTAGSRKSCWTTPSEHNLHWFCGFALLVRRFVRSTSNNRSSGLEDPGIQTPTRSFRKIAPPWLPSLRPVTSAIHDPPPYPCLPTEFLSLHHLPPP